MARSIVAPLLITALFAAAAPTIVGCQAHASAHLGTPEPPPPPPAPVAAPTPPPAPVVAPAPTPAPVVAPAAPKTVTNKGGVLGLPGNIVFETGKDVLKPESEPTLQALKDFLDLEANKTFTRIRIEGHTDNAGTPKANLDLSVKRATAVAQWLVGKGIAKDRLLAVGFGDTRPIADNGSDAGKAQNRRTEFHIAEAGGKPWLNKDETAGGTVAPGQATPPAPAAPKAAATPATPAAPAVPAVKK